MSGYFIQTPAGKQGPFHRGQIIKLVEAGKLPLDFDVEHETSGLLISVGDIVPAGTGPTETAAAPPPPPPKPAPPELVIEDAELSPEDFAPSLKAAKGIRKKGDRAALRQAARPVAPPPEPTGAPAVRRAAPARGSAGTAERRGVVRNSPARGGRAQRSGRARSSSRYQRPASKAPWIVSGVLIVVVGVLGYFFWDDINIWGSPFEGTWKIDLEGMAEANAPASATEEQKEVLRNLMKLMATSDNPKAKAMREARFVFKGDHFKGTLKGSVELDGKFAYSKISRFEYRVKWPDETTSDVYVKGDYFKLDEGGNTVVLQRE